MGFFSDIVDFVKGAISGIMSAIASLVNGAFGSPLVFALCIFVVSFMIMTPLMFEMMMSSPMLFLTEHVILSGMIAGALVTVVSAVCPDLGRVLGFAFGVISFIQLGFSMYALYTGLGQSGVTLAATYFGTFFEEASREALVAQMATWFTFIGVTSVVALIGGLSDGVNADGSFKSSYVSGYINGLFAIPTIIAAAADSATGGLWGYLALGALAYLAVTSRPKGGVSVKVASSRRSGALQ